MQVLYESPKQAQIVMADQRQLNKLARSASNLTNSIAPRLASKRDTVKGANFVVENAELVVEGDEVLATRVGAFLRNS